MDVTELAHWRYRVKAITADVAAGAEALTGVKEMANSFRWSGGGLYSGEPSVFDPEPNSWDDEADKIQTDLYRDRYLLEEAKYKVELGETESLDTVVEYLAAYLSGLLLP